jgi:NhaP-type Na+/H+ and K+/H+ antiporter
MIRLAPVALLALALMVPTCTGTVWGNLILLVIVCGIFFGTVTIGQPEAPKEGGILADDNL